MEDAELIYGRRQLNVDSLKLTDSGHVFVKARDWGSRGDEDAMTIHFGMGMYGAPRVGDTVMISIERPLPVPVGTNPPPA